MYTRDLKDIGVKITDKGFLRKGFAGGEHRRLLLNYYGRMLDADAIIYSSGEGRITQVFGLSNAQETTELIQERTMDFNDDELQRRLAARCIWLMITLLSVVLYLVMTVILICKVNVFATPFVFTEYFSLLTAVLVVILSKAHKERRE